MMVSSSHRGVSEVITTLLILAMTLVGALFLSIIMSDSDLTNVGKTVSDIPPNSIKLTGYDTRDSVNLSNIIQLDNNFDQELCTDSCALYEDNIPLSVSNEGTHFIVLKIKNTYTKPVFIHNVQINNVLHSWDPNTSGKLLETSVDDFTGKYPLGGQFSIIPESDSVQLLQQSTNQLLPDQEVRLVIKLSGDIAPDILVWRPLQIHINFGANQPAEFIILSGDTR